MSLKPPYPDVLALIQRDGQRLPPDAIKGADWTLTDTASADRLSKMRSAGVPLGEYVKGQIFYGVKTGFNEAFVINGTKRAELISADPNSAEIIKPLAVGRDIRRWAIANRDQWLIFTRRGTDIDKYPAIKAHLSQWQEELTPKKTGKEEKGRAPSDGQWYEIQASPAETTRFDKPKIVYQEIATYQSFAYDTKGTYVNNKIFMLPNNDLYLLGVLNSTPAWEYLNAVCSKLVGGALAMQSSYVSTLPIPNATPADKSAIAALVQHCLDAGGVDCGVWEAEIDARVAALYGL